MKCCGTCEIIEALFMAAMAVGMGVGMACSIWMLVDGIYSAFGKGQQTPTCDPEREKDDSP